MFEDIPYLNKAQTPTLTGKGSLIVKAGKRASQASASRAVHVLMLKDTRSAFSGSILT